MALFIRNGSVLAQAFAVFLCVMGFFAVHITVYDEIGPTDEQAHLDYVYKLAHGSIPRANELMGQEAIRQEACKRIDSPYEPPPCLPDGEVYDVTAFQFGGVSAAAGHPPYYYVPGAIAVRIAEKLGQHERWVNAARLGGAMWAAVGAVLLWLIALQLGAGWIVRVGVVALTVAAAQPLHAAVTVNNDGSAVFAGALLLSLVVFRVRLLWVALAAAFVVLLKATNILAVLVAVAAVVWISLVERRRSGDGSTDQFKTWFKILFPALGILIVTAAASFGWGMVVSTRAAPELATSSVSIGPPPAPFVVATVFTSPLQGAPVTNFLASNTWFSILNAYGNYLFVGAGVGGMMLLRQSGRMWGILATAGMLLGPSVIMLSIWAGAGSLFHPSPRYGLSLLPIILMPIMIGMRSKFASVAVGAVGMGLLFAVLASALAS